MQTQLNQSQIAIFLVETKIVLVNPKNKYYTTSPLISRQERSKRKKERGREKIA